MRFVVNSVSPTIDSKIQQSSNKKRNYFLGVTQRIIDQIRIVGLVSVLFIPSGHVSAECLEQDCPDDPNVTLPPIVVTAPPQPPPPSAPFLPGGWPQPPPAPTDPFGSIQLQ